MKKALNYFLIFITLFILSSCTARVTTAPVPVKVKTVSVYRVWIPGHFNPYGRWIPGHWRYVR